jgi:hypothetical protein
MRSFSKAGVVVACLGLGAACAALRPTSVGVRGHGGPVAPRALPDGRPIPPSGTPADVGRPTPSPGAVSGPGSGVGDAGTRVVCRGTAPPSGWIAINYVPAPEQCPRRGAGAPSADSTANAAVLTRYAGHAVGTVLRVCADQRTPADWGLVAEGDDARTADGGARCPGAVREGAPTTRRIRRLR